MTNTLFDNFLGRLSLPNDAYNRSVARIIMRENLERIYEKDEAAYTRDFVGVPRINMKGKLGADSNEQNPMGRLKYVREIANDKLYLSSYPKIDFQSNKADLLKFLYLYMQNEDVQEEKICSYLESMTEYLNNRFNKWRGE